LTLSLALIVVGGLIAADLSVLDVPPVAYLAAPLAVLGLGLLIGTWVGRARWLIPIGILLSLAVGGGWLAADSDWSRPSAGQISVSPESVGSIQDSYERAVGEIDLDLSGVDFEGRDVAVTLRIDLGSIVVTLPPDVDVIVDAGVDIGSASVLGQSWDGFGNGSRTVEDLGRDGEGGGTLHITASVGIGNLEIER
jgi:hypothetical protein